MCVTQFNTFSRSIDFELLNKDTTGQFLATHQNIRSMTTQEEICTTTESPKPLEETTTHAPSTAERSARGAEIDKKHIEGEEAPAGHEAKRLIPGELLLQGERERLQRLKMKRTRKRRERRRRAREREKELQRKFEVVPLEEVSPPPPQRDEPVEIEVIPSLSPPPFPSRGILTKAKKRRERRKRAKQRKIQEKEQVPEEKFPEKQKKVMAKERSDHEEHENRQQINLKESQPSEYLAKTKTERREKEKDVDFSPIKESDEHLIEPKTKTQTEQTEKQSPFTKERTQKDSKRTTERTSRNKKLQRRKRKEGKQTHMKTKPLEVREIFELTTTVSEELLPQQPESKRKKRRKPRRRREKMKTAHTPEEHRLQMEAQQARSELFRLTEQHRRALKLELECMINLLEDARSRLQRKLGQTQEESSCQ